MMIDDDMLPWVGYLVVAVMVDDNKLPWVGYLAVVADNFNLVKLPQPIDNAPGNLFAATYLK